MHLCACDDSLFLPEWVLIYLHRFPGEIVVDGMDITPSTAPKAGDDDFFSSWDKPATPKSPATPSGMTSPPVIGRAAAPAAPRTISSSSIRSTNSTTSSARPSKVGASRLGSSSSTTSSAGASTAAKKPKVGGLGAKKAAAPIDFAEAERKAEEEAERVKQLGLDKQRQEEEEKARKQAESLAAAANAKSKATEPAPQKANGKGKVDTSKAASPDLERLGMGFGRLGFGAVPSSGAASATSTRSR